MLKSIKSILITILLMLILIMMMYVIPTHMARKNFTKEEINKESTIVINKDGSVNCSDIIKLISLKEYLEFPLTICEGENEKTLEVESVLIDGEEIEIYQNNKSGLTYVILDGYNIFFRNTTSLMGKEHVININYKYNTSNVITKYNDITLMKLHCTDIYKDYRVKLKFPDEKMLIKCQKPLNIINNINKDMWEINLSNILVKDSELGFIIKNNIIDNINVVDTDYYNSLWDYIELIKDNSLFKIIYTICISIEIISLIILAVFYRKSKVEKEYIRDTKLIIDPILAEAIIDKKIGTKELIMTTISNMICKGNLKCVDNDTVELIHKNGLTRYEEKILSIILNNKKIIRFEEIKDIFKKENYSTQKIYSKLKEIKQYIFDALLNEKIYSITHENVLYGIRVVAKIINVESICLIILMFIINATLTDYIKINLGVLVLMGIFKCIIKIKERLGGNNVVSVMFKIFTTAFLPLFIIICFFIIKSIDFIIVFLLITILVILNIIVLRLADTHVLTSKGKEEYKKAYGLKSYIEDYSLMQERELESTILWDDYLTYAIAFGISNKVLDRFGEDLMKVNISLQRLDNILKF